MTKLILNPDGRNIMPIAQQPEDPKQKDRQKREDLKAIIGKHVTHSLHDISGLCKVQVRPLWGNFYRVNVVIEDEVGSIKIPHSYFLEVDGDGNIIESTPKITRLAVALT